MIATPTCFSRQAWGRTSFTVGLFLVLLANLIPYDVMGETIYSYTDERGIPVLTNNYDSIPERYRAKAKVMEQTPKTVGQESSLAGLQRQAASWLPGARVNSNVRGAGHFGLSPYQSDVLDSAVILAIICFVARTFVRSQVIVFLANWCLILMLLTVPVLIYTSQDAPLDLLRGQAGKIQEKQQGHLKTAP